MTLETERLTLRPMTPADFGDIYQLFSDPQVMAAFQSEPLNKQQAQKWLDRNLKHQKEHGYSLFAAVHKVDCAVIGNCGLTHYEIDGKHELEIGYDLHSSYWGRGLATEAATAVRNYAFNILKQPRLIGLARQTNAASMRVLEKIGMHREKDLTLSGVNYWLYAIENLNASP